MLQQTQVATVIPYFLRFMQRFPTVKHLARATPDQVMQLWTGLGYYARARNLHAAARTIVAEHGGQFPRTLDAVQALPGVGRSTAGAILALAFDQRHAILDGNVKRVLARYYAIDRPLNGRDIETTLWALAEGHTPRTRVADYTQAIMDLGATVCRRTQPDCARCPVQRSCRAFARGTPDRYPRRAQRSALPIKRINMLMVRDRKARVLLLQRPPAGLWGGLWSLPECKQTDVRAYTRKHLGVDIAPATPWPTFRHSFSHFHLDITPIPARLLGAPGEARETNAAAWVKLSAFGTRGLPAPVRRLLQQLRTEES